MLLVEFVVRLAGIIRVKRSLALFPASRTGPLPGGRGGGRARLCRMAGYRAVPGYDGFPEPRPEYHQPARSMGHRILFAALGSGQHGSDRGGIRRTRPDQPLGYQNGEGSPVWGPDGFRHPYRGLWFFILPGHLCQGLAPPCPSACFHVPRARIRAPERRCAQQFFLRPYHQRLRGGGLHRYTFQLKHPDSPLVPWVWGGMLGTAATVGALRIFRASISLPMS